MFEWLVAKTSQKLAARNCQLCRNKDSNQRAMEDTGNKKQRANHQQGCEAVLLMCHMLGLWLTCQWAWHPWGTILMMTLLDARKEEVSVVQPHQECPCVLWGGHTQKQGENLYQCWYRGEGTFYLDPSKGSAWNKQQIPPMNCAPLSQLVQLTYVTSIYALFLYIK